MYYYDFVLNSNYKNYPTNITTYICVNFRTKLLELKKFLNPFKRNTVLLTLHYQPFIDYIIEQNITNVNN